jgi:hypothetical protein
MWVFSECPVARRKSFNCFSDIITSFMKRISLIMNRNWIFIPRCSIIHLSPLFSSKKIEFGPADLRAFFLVHHGFPGNAALILRKKKSESR